MISALGWGWGAYVTQRVKVFYHRRMIYFAEEKVQKKKEEFTELSGYLASRFLTKT